MNDDPLQAVAALSNGSDKSGAAWQRTAMRTTNEDSSVRLYNLTDGPEGGSADTLFYGPLSRALELAAQQPADVQDGLFIATENDVIAYLDLIEE